jgi:hypothetical protein
MKSALPNSQAKERSMNLRTFIVTAAAIVGLAAPAAATARILPIKHPGQLARHGHTQAHRVVRCICVVAKVTPVQVTQEQAELLYDQDLIDHGLAPVYGTTAATTAD